MDAKDRIMVKDIGGLPLNPDTKTHSGDITDGKILLQLIRVNKQLESGKKLVVMPVNAVFASSS